MAKWTAAKRKQYLQDHPENFAGPDGSYPIEDGEDVKDAWGLAGHADSPDAIRAKVKEIAKRLGLTSALPDTAKTEESTAASATIARPAKKIATLPICWLEYNARSLNGRIYPKATCDAIFEAARKKIADLDASDPPTTFVSHEDANHNVNTHLVGGPTKVWQEGSKFWANIDMADTSIARDMVALIEGRYLRSGSIRVLGVELHQDRNYDLPLVVVQEGVEPVFQGIDLTTRPGLVDTARIPQVLYEEASQPPFTESFDFEILPIQKETSMGIPMYAQIALGMLQEAMTPDREAHQRVHDHLAGVLDETVKAVHGSESARLRSAVQISEEGRAIAQKHAVRLVAAHDESAKACGMTCEGAYNEALGIAPSDTDHDGDNPAAGNDPDHDGESARRRNNTMTEEEALALLRGKGYNVAPPKTAEEQINELRQLVEAQNQKIAALETTPPPQRQTQSPSSMSENTTYQPEAMYEDGDYLKGPLAPDHWKAMTNRRVPWPKDLDPKTALHELAPILAYRLMTQEAVSDAKGRTVLGLRSLDERF